MSTVLIAAIIGLVVIVLVTFDWLKREDTALDRFIAEQTKKPMSEAPRKRRLEFLHGERRRFMTSWNESKTVGGAKSYKAGILAIEDEIDALTRDTDKA